MRYRAYTESGLIVIRFGVQNYVTTIPLTTGSTTKEALFNAGWIMHGDVATDVNGNPYYRVTPRPKGRS